MKNLILTSLSISVLLTQSAFAQNLGRLNDEQAPRALMSASEFLNGLHSSHSLRSSDPANELGEYENRYGEYGGGYGTGYGTGYGYGNTGYGYGNTGYGYGNTGYGNMGYGYGSTYPSYYLRLDDRSEHSRITVQQHPINNDLSPNTSVVCFATDSSGNWYANSDTLSNVALTQQAVNHECSASNLNCAQNLGCAVALGDR